MKGVESERQLNGSLKASSLRLPPPSLLFALSFLAYATVLNSYFLSDDFAQIGRVLEGDWSLAWGREHGGFFRPVFIVSYILDSRVWGENPLGYHLTNTFVHGLNSFFVYKLARRLFARQSFSEDARLTISFVAGILFLLHPSHTEAVSWISGRADLLATLFSFTTLAAYVCFAETRRVLHLALGLLAFTLALLSKEMAASLPLMLLAVCYCRAPEGNAKAALKESLRTTAPFFATLFLFILVRRAVLGAWVGGYGTEQHLNFSPGWLRDRFLQATLRALAPAFSPELSAILLKPLKSRVFILSSLACALLIVLLLRRRRAIYQRSVRREQNSLVLFLVVMFILSLLPVINLRLSLFDTQGERFVYWPSAFTSIMIAYLSFILLRSKKIWLALMLCLSAFYSISLYRTNQTWREAALLSRSIKDEIARSATNEKRLIVLNAPDNLRGVPVFHNGLDEALRLFQKERPIETTRVLALHDLNSIDDEVELKKENDGLSLRLLNGADLFVSVAEDTQCLEILERSRTELRFRPVNCADSFAAFFFSSGEMYRVIDYGPPKAQE